MKRTGTRTIFGRNPHYQFRDQDPIFDTMRSLWRMSGLSLQQLADTTGLHYSTLYGWFVEKRVVSCRHDSAQIFFGSFGVPYKPDMSQRSNVVQFRVKAS